MPSAADHPAARDPRALLAELREVRTRGPGPGGQHRNKVETHVTLTHPATGLVGRAGERRSLEQNRQMALGRLRLALALEHRVPLVAGRQVPSELWRRRTGGASLSVAQDHADVPALLAEALDLLAACGDDLAASAARLDVTPSRLLRVLKLAPAALVALNARRRSRGEPALR